MNKVLLVFFKFYYQDDSTLIINYAKIEWLLKYDSYHTGLQW